MKKKIIIDHRASREFSKFSEVVYVKFLALFDILIQEGFLSEPLAKKIKSEKNLFELRVKLKGQFRAFYAYVRENDVIILSAFNKRTQKTPLKEINKAIKRLREYI